MPHYQAIYKAAIGNLKEGFLTTTETAKKVVKHFLQSDIYNPKDCRNNNKQTTLLRYIVHYKRIRIQPLQTRPTTK
jgi:hypothetical protein